MKKDIKELEKELAKITGRESLPRGALKDIKSGKPFNAAEFVRLGEEVKKIFEEDAKTTNLASPFR